MVRQTYQKKTATVSERHPYVADVDASLAAVVEDVTVGDRIEVAYTRTDGGHATATGTVTEVDAEFGDVRFRTHVGACYLHINTDTGAYYFNNGHRESPEDGFRLRRVDVTPRQN